MFTPAQRLRLARSSAGYPSAAAFAAAANLTEPTYRSHENGARGLTTSAATLYAARLGNCTAAWLLTGEGAGPAVTGDVPDTLAAGETKTPIPSDKRQAHTVAQNHVVTVRDLPVFATSAGNLPGAFRLALGNPIDFACRPPMLAGAEQPVPPL